MALEEYKKKRNFSKSPEPAGEKVTKKKQGPFFFCVQKHLASHLHYDFRLEWNGVLLSWAVPKGPSIDPSDKRLAMHVEDHPFEYGTFEGVIPEGYGAGIVMLWDRGTWTPESDDVEAALKKGDLKFTLDGFKLKGSWVLVKTRGYGDQSGRPGRSWLLIKHRDDWAGAVDITTFAPYSVKTPDADLADILASDNPDIWHSNAPAKGGDAAMMFRKIIQQALEIKEGNVGAGSRAKKTHTKAATSTKARSTKTSKSMTAAKRTNAAKSPATRATKSR
ncbi:MAG TPA: DNA polymerase ligase N-terminal domain-containing protein [Vicinamibacterales bacterium]|nr:DNA polymerase ligase N-terminal domain-containing protein [Vicinamibacterales bacterium]